MPRRVYSFLWDNPLVRVYPGVPKGFLIELVSGAGWIERALAVQDGPLFPGLR